MSSSSSPSKEKTDETTSRTTTPSTTPACDRDELLELVRAIKFAKPEASQKEVHREITEEISQKFEHKFAFLKDVKLNDVKKVWKKAMQQHSSSTNSTSSTTPLSQQGAHSTNADLLEKLPSDQTVKVFTVGDGSVKHLAQEYTAAVLAQAAAKEQAAAEELQKNYVHVFLDVPADRSGSRPHQALINFQESAKNKTEKQTKQQLSKTNNSEEMMIVKIQMAAPLNEHDTVQHPMLLYNQSRSCKTFLHPDPNDETKSYERVQEWIRNSGVDGVLGQKGGTKAYFNSRLTKRKKGQNIISIRVAELAPPQEW
jgi:hypothetical protein